MGEQIEAVRRLRVAGWLAFCNGTWYHDVQHADTILPYPANESAKRALSPILVALNMPERQFFTGAMLRPKVFVINDGLPARDLHGLTVLIRVESSAGRVLSEIRHPSRMSPCQRCGRSKLKYSFRRACLQTARSFS